jgi:tRNA dimethylallyltransferase
MTVIVPVIFGPTGSGKSGLALALAERLGGEIVNADSRQVYRHMPIITACPTAEDYGRVPHHLYEFLEPSERYSSGAWANAAAGVIREVLGCGKVPVVVGGTGFYLWALLEGLSPLPEVPDEVFEAVEAEVDDDREGALARLREVDPVWADKLMPTDTQRIARGLAVWRASGKRFSAWQEAPLVRPEMPEGIRFVKVGLNPPREMLHQRLAARWGQMVEMGLLDEMRGLKERGYTPDLPALSGLGIAELFAHLEGKGSLEAAVEAGLASHRQYAKRQVTWLRNQYDANLTLNEPNVAELHTGLAKLG